jgi:hypothetical protein
VIFPFLGPALRILILNCPFREAQTCNGITFQMGGISFRDIYSGRLICRIGGLSGTKMYVYASAVKQFAAIRMVRPHRSGPFNFTIEARLRVLQLFLPLSYLRRQLLHIDLWWDRLAEPLQSGR